MLRRIYTYSERFILTILLSVLAIQVNADSKHVLNLEEAISICKALEPGTRTEEAFDIKGVISGACRSIVSPGHLNVDMMFGDQIFYLYRLSNIDSLKFEHFHDLRVGDTIIVHSRLENYNNIPSSYFGYITSHKKYIDPSPELFQQTQDREWQLVLNQQGHQQQTHLTIVLCVATSILFLILLLWAYSLSVKSEHDYMTKLYNRYGGESRTLFEFNSLKAGFFFILDLDSFKKVNDKYGHSIGDRCIILFAQTMKKHFAKDLTMRIGGDEFAIFIEEGNNTLESVQARIKEFFKDVDAIRIEGYPDLRISSSVGAAYYNGAKSVHYEETYKYADEALYASKQNKGCYLTFSNKAASRKSSYISKALLLAIVSLLGFSNVEAQESKAIEEPILTTQQADSISRLHPNVETSKKDYLIQGVIDGYCHVQHDSIYLRAELEMGDSTFLVYYLADIDSIPFSSNTALSYKDTILIRSRVGMIEGVPWAPYGYLVSIHKYIDPVKELIAKNKEKEWLLLISEEQHKAHNTVNIIVALCAIISLLSLLLWLITSDHRSKTDYMTKINNRYGGELKINNLLLKNTKGYYCVIDVDKFKYVNDHIGHTSGDECLIKLCDLMKKHFNGNVIMRLGGDEFALFLKIENKEKLEASIQEFFNKLDTLRLDADPNYRIVVSVGVAFCNGRSSTIDKLYSEADRNLYKSKEINGCHLTV